MTRLFIILLGLVSLTEARSLYAQSSNFRAQGNYYSAKSSLENKDYSGAIRYINKSKENLGGTNEQLQYLHILAAYYMGNHEEASKELEKFFAIEDGSLEPVSFDKSVDRLTQDETRSLTILIDPIFEAVERKKREQERLNEEAMLRKTHACKQCNATGYVQKIEKCRYCSGSGKETKACHICSGRGNYRCGNCYAGYYTVYYNNSSWQETCTSCNGTTSIACRNCVNGYLTNICGTCRSAGIVKPTGEQMQCDACNGKGYSK